MSCGSSHTSMQCKTPTRHDGVCLHHTYHAHMIPGVSISFQTALSTSTRRLVAHLVPALTIHPREIQTLWSQNNDTGSYDTLYEVGSSSSDVVIYWTMTGTHVVPDRRQYDAHTNNYILQNTKYFSVSYQTALSTTIRRWPAHPASALTFHPREIQALWSHNHDTDSYDTLY